MYEKKLYILTQEIFSTTRVRARFLLLIFFYIHGTLNNNVISSEVLMKFSSKVKINVKKLNSEVISRLVRAFVHARAHIDKITYFFRETLNIWIFLHGI